MKKILVIEDNQAILENTAEILELSKYQVVTASNGTLGLEKALATHPDLILCDIMMPGLNGYDVLHRLHDNPVLKQTPFIFLTAKTEKRDINKGIELGADDYISKPFSATELLCAVNKKLNANALA